MHDKAINLGDLSNRESLLIFGGCYSNLESTKALYDWANTQGFEADRCICTGDIVAYCANPVETIDLIRNWGVNCIQGNVEQSLAKQADDCGCGFEEGSVCDALSKDWFSYANMHVTSSQRAWFANLPQQLSFSFHGQQIQIVHGAVSHVSRFMFASQGDIDFFEEFKKIPKTDIVISGHSGLPFTRRLENKIWHNSGALGMPANDGTQRVWFSTLEIDASEQIILKHHALNYDVETTCKLMLDKNLDQGYHMSLKSGLWPSMDVLPEKEKQQQGLALNFGG